MALEQRQQRVVVIGGGMAGARLAQQLDAADVDLTVVGEEPHAPYNRVLLAEVLAGQYAPEVIALPASPARWMRGVRAVRLDRAERRVICDDGSVLPYDALVLATGANPVLPPLRGLFDHDGGELPDGVRAFRTMDDCLALRDDVKPGTRAVVVGGGLLGVSAARALARRGAQVVLAHQGERLMERQLDTGAAAVLRRHLEELDVEVHTECRARGLRTPPGSHASSRVLAPAPRTVSAVELADGYSLDADLVVLACGVRPRVGLAQAAGLEVAQGVVVDDQLRTNDPHVHAIGDCAEHAGILYGLAGPAQDQADALSRVLTDTAPTPAAARAAGSGTGIAPRYPGTRALTRLSLTRNRQLPLDLAAFGEPTPREDDDVVHLTDATRGTYRKVVVRGDRLVGGILLGDLASVGTLARTWEGDEPLPSEPLLHLLTHDGGR
ncbi:MAG TPA: FAD-dependent oxidoreductase [Streptomyces sp.]|nr:FAD-dependent oxidoreductase [Streptomyces sp.]